MPVNVDTIRQYALKIVQGFQPEKIILYGSYAYGHPTEDSDIDLLVIMGYQGHCLDVAQDIKKALNLPSNAHLLVKPPEEVAWRYKGSDPLIKDALNKGKILYERATTGRS